MKKIILFSTVLLLGLGVVAQQRPHYTQYILNSFILNPAVTGIENYVDLKLSARDQWTGLDGAPRTSYLSVHGPIGKSDYRTSSTSFEIPGENPRGKYYWENYTAAEPHHGIGLTMVNDKTGSFNRFTINATYAYHLGLSPTTNLSAGFAAGITNVSINRSKHDFDGQGDPFDPSLGGGSISKEINRVKPDLGVGLWLYSRYYFVGLSAQQVIPQKLVFTDDAAYVGEGRMVPHAFLSAGFRFLLRDEINVVPSVMMKYVKNSSKNDFQPEFNLKLQYMDLFWVGGSYRYQDGYAAMGGLNVSNLFNVGYAYDFTTTELNTVAKGTHEIMIGILINNKYSEKCPRCW